MLLYTETRFLEAILKYDNCPCSNCQNSIKIRSFKDTCDILIMTHGLRPNDEISSRSEDTNKQSRSNDNFCFERSILVFIYLLYYTLR